MKRPLDLAALLFGAAALGGLFSLPKPTPALSEEMIRVSRAMDDTGLRFAILQLRRSVGEGDAVFKEASLAALRRYGSRARAMLREEAAKEPNEAVRRALEEAARDLR